MKRLVLVALTAIALATPPASANPTATTSVRDLSQIQLTYYDPNSGYSVGGYIRVDRATSVAPSANPGNVFPIVVDPNDPPEPGVSATEDEVYVDGQIGVCTYQPYYGYQCSRFDFDETHAASLEVEMLPAPGNALRWSISVVAQGNLGPQPITVTGVAQRPGFSVTRPLDTELRINPWFDGAQAHVDTQAWIPVIDRYNYDVSGTFTTSQGTFPASYGNAYYQQLIPTNTDVTLP